MVYIFNDKSNTSVETDCGHEALQKTDCFLTQNKPRKFKILSRIRLIKFLQAASNHTCSMIKVNNFFLLFVVFQTAISETVSSYELGTKNIKIVHSMILITNL